MKWKLDEDEVSIKHSFISYMLGEGDINVDDVYVEHYCWLTARFYHYNENFRICRYAGGLPTPNAHHVLTH